VTIPPGLARHCDLVALGQPIVGDVAEAGAIAALQIEAAPVDQRHWIAGAIYELELAVCGRDIDARFYATTIEFDGKWHDEPSVWDNLRINPFREGRAR
jgi:hypothetical protein